MIIAERKDLKQITEMLEGRKRVLVAGCRSCVSICHAGGEKEVAIMAEALRLKAEREGREMEVSEVAVERQCEKEWVRGIERQVAAGDIVLSMACVEKCGGCGDCVLHLTGGVCPIARCAKSLLNGPCGGSQDGRCEVDRETPCGWEQIYQSLGRLGRLDLLEVNIPPRSWLPSRSGGPRRTVRPSVAKGAEERAAEVRR